MTATVHPSPAERPAARLDVSGTPGVPMTRLVGVELRKMADTRAGFWLLAAIVLVTGAILVIFSFAADKSEHTFLNYMGITATPQGFLLPVLGVLLITSEWGQRTALTTFTTTPHRGRILTAKVAAAVLFGLAAIVVAIALAAVFTLVAGSDDAWAGIGLDDFGKFGLLQTMGVLQGLAFGMLLLNSAAAIVAYFVLPIAFSIVTSLVSWFADVQPWVDLGTSQTPLFSGEHVTGEQWAQLATGALIWIALPLLLGAVRVLRAEVKSA